MSAKAAMDLAQRYEEDLALMQRYPLIAGVVNGHDSFGWEFNPRLRIVTEERAIRADRTKHVYWLEPGVRHCYALIAVRDDRVEADKKLLNMNEEDLKAVAFSKSVRLVDFNELNLLYERVLSQVPKNRKEQLKEQLEKEPTGSDSEDFTITFVDQPREASILEGNLPKETLGAEKDLGSWNDFNKSLERWQNNHKELIKLMDRDVQKKHEKLLTFNADDFKKMATKDERGEVEVRGVDIDGIQKLYAAAIVDTKERVPGYLNDYFNRLNSEVFPVDAKDLAKWEKFQMWVGVHHYILNLCGHQGINGIKELEISIEKKWFNRSTGEIFNPKGEIFTGAADSMLVKLPQKRDRTLVEIRSVSPNTGAITQETVVTIRGENFSNDSRVFVGGHEVKPENVSVVGRGLIVATFPAIHKDVLEDESEKKFDVSVITGGDTLTAYKAFTYTRPPEKPPEKPIPFVATLSANEGKPAGYIKIKANRPVMDEVETIQFGELPADKSSWSRSANNKVLTFTVPQGNNTSLAPRSGTKVHVILKFEDDSGIVPRDEYELEELFTYEY